MDEMTAAEYRARAVRMLQEAGYSSTSGETRDRHIATAAVWAELARSAAMSEDTAARIGAEIRA